MILKTFGDMGWKGAQDGIRGEFLRCSPLTPQRHFGALAARSLRTRPSLIKVFENHTSKNDATCLPKGAKITSKYSANTSKEALKRGVDSSVQNGRKSDPHRTLSGELSPLREHSFHSSTLPQKGLQKGTQKLSKWRPEGTEQRFVGHPPKVSEIQLLFHRFEHPERVQHGAQILDFLRFWGFPAQSGPTGLS